MANYDPYDRDYAPRHYVREERRDPARPSFLDVRDYPNKTHYSRDLVPRARQDSDLSVEEIRREFPPPSGRDIRRARSAEPYWEEEHYRRAQGYGDRRDRERDRDYDSRSRRGGGSVYDDDDRRKSKTMTKQEKIIAAVAGAALLAGGKELYDRREAKSSHTDVHRNPLSSVAFAGLGALAGYQGAEFYSKQQAKKDQKTNAILHRGRDGQIEYYSDEDGDSKEKKSSKNFLESALAATGLGAAVKTLTGSGDKDKHSDRSRHGSPTGSRRGGSRSGSHERSGGGNKIQKAAMASLLAGATEAFRVAREPGGWRGEKAKRIVTAAAGAATVDAAHGAEHGKLGLAQSVIGGLVGNRLINGSKRDIEEDRETGRSRSRSRARSENGRGGHGGATGLAALATAGLGAIGAKKMLDRSRSRSRSQSRSRGRGGSYDSRSPSPDRRRQRSRSRSVVDKARNSLAKLGIGAGAAGAVDDHRRRDQDDFDDYGSRRPRRHDDYDDYDDDRYVRSERAHRGGGSGGGSGRDRSRSRRRGGSRSRSGYGSDTDLGDSSEDEKAARKMRGKQVLTTGLAAVATIHAAHNVYQSMDKRNARQRAVREGRLTEVEAKKLKTKAIMQDAASVGIAALGIKGALEELKEAKEMQHECKTFQSEKARRHERRLERQQRRRGMGPRQRSGSWSAPSSRPSLPEWDDHPRYYDDGVYDMRSALPPPYRV